MNKHEAIYKLYPQVKVIRGDVAYDADGNEVVYDENAVIVEMDKVAYIDKRVAEYPPIGDQLDALFHAGVFPQEMADKIQAVKNKYPKGSE
jgi:hypothetical protein